MSQRNILENLQLQENDYKLVKLPKQETLFSSVDK